MLPTLNYISRHFKSIKFQASICRSATRSTQTQKSDFRRGAQNQAAPPKNQEVQTKKDNSTNTKKFQTYIFGLRGRRDNTQHVLTIVDDLKT